MWLRFVGGFFIFQEGFGPFWRFKNWVFCKTLGVQGPIYVSHGAFIYEGEINKDAYIRMAAEVEIGSDVHIDYSGGLEIGNGVTISSGTHILTHNHSVTDPKRHWREQEIIFIPLRIGDGVWIGANAIILPQVRSIGEGAVVGAGAVVTKDVAPFSIVGGNPARVIGWRGDPPTSNEVIDANSD